MGLPRDCNTRPAPRLHSGPGVFKEAGITHAADAMRDAFRGILNEGRHPVPNHVGQLVQSLRKLCRSLSAPAVQHEDVVPVEPKRASIANALTSRMRWSLLTAGTAAASLCDEWKGCAATGSRTLASSPANQSSRPGRKNPALLPVFAPKRAAVLRRTARKWKPRAQLNLRT